MPGEHSGSAAETRSRRRRRRSHLSPEQNGTAPEELEPRGDRNGARNPPDSSAAGSSLAGSIFRVFLSSPLPYVRDSSNFRGRDPHSSSHSFIDVPKGGAHER